jgi:anti-sigma regulatory factor (Ser/Thr protein kinase)
VPAAATPHALRHDALFYDSEEALASSAVSFVREGVELGETVLVTTPPMGVTRLLAAVFADEPRVQIPGAKIYSTPAAAMDRYQRLLDQVVRAGSPGIRAIGQTDLSGTTLPWQEWLRYEAAVNRFLADWPLQTLCLYDVRAVPEERLQWMRRAHPTRFENGVRVDTDGYLEPDELVGHPECASPPDPLQSTEPTLELDHVTDLRSLRIDIYPALWTTELSVRQVDDYVKAVGEVAMNAVAHGLGPVRVKVWAAPRKLVCTVHDQGPGIDDPLLGYGHPARSSLDGEDPTKTGLGLWAARQLCDLLDYRTTEEGFTVRLVSMAR